MADAFHILRKAVTQLPDHSDIILVGPDTSAPIKIKKKKGNMLTGTEQYLNEQVTLFSSSPNHIEGFFFRGGEDQAPRTFLQTSSVNKNHEAH